MKNKRFSISLIPNLTFKDVLISLKYLLIPWFWIYCRTGSYQKQAEDLLKNKLGLKYLFLVDKGRSALHLALKALDIKKGDEVIIQAFTCVVVPNAILSRGAIPIYADIDPETLNPGVEQIEKKITPKTKAILVQHTFGYAPKIQAIQKLAQKHHLWLIEDCAHCLGAKQGQVYLGHFGDIVIYSFGRDKVISCVNGGAVASNHLKLGRKLSQLMLDVSKPSYIFLLRSLLHSVCFYMALPWYGTRFKIGEGFILFLQKMALLEKVYTPCERQGSDKPPLPKKLANSLAEILVHQLSLLDDFNEHRVKLAKLYYRELNDVAEIKHPPMDPRHIYFRYTIQVEDPQKLVNFVKLRGIYLGRWYKRVIVPLETDLETVKYAEGSCPCAEQVAKKVVNLPNHFHVKFKEARVLCEIIKDYYAG